MTEKRYHHPYPEGESLFEDVWPLDPVLADG